jgi:hypothetical protein
VLTQAQTQYFGLLLRPLAYNCLIPTGWASAYYQNVTVLGDGAEYSQSIATRANAQAKLWQGQAHAVLGILVLFTILVWLNLAVLLRSLPLMAKSLLGIETMFSRSIGTYLNTTFLAATVALTSLVVDPLRKALFVLRCFSGESLTTGEDLTAELREIRTGARTVVTVLCFAFVVLTAADFGRAAPEPPKSVPTDPTELDQRIGEVLERREFAWRAPRDKAAPTAKSEGWFQSWLKSASKSVENFLSLAARQLGRGVKWLVSLFNPPTVPSPNGLEIDWAGLGKAFLVLLGAALVGVLGWLLVRIFSTRKRKPVIATEAAAMPDLHAADLVADQLPEDGWLRLAREHAARGELSLAVRAAWLAGLAHLGERELIGIARHKSNRDYERELRRRARDRGELMKAFDENLNSFERSWYGEHEVTPEHYAQVEENHESIRKS